MLVFLLCWNGVYVLIIFGVIYGGFIVGYLFMLGSFYVVELFVIKVLVSSIIGVMCLRVILVVI